MGQFPQQQYLVISVKALLDPGPIAEWEKELNRLYLNGWKLHSFTPQTDENSVFCNVAVFERNN
ncbi:MAG: hypothetical protein ACQEXV_16610 [Bacillota bacterium]